MNQTWSEREMSALTGGISSEAERDIIKTGTDIIKNLDILLKTPHLLSKTEIYYQKHICCTDYTQCRISVHNPFNPIQPTMQAHALPPQLNPVAFS
jgi:hypothetical protein